MPFAWQCQSCGFTSPWLRTADAFPLCVKCESLAQAERTRQIRLLAERIARLDALAAAIRAKAHS